MKVKRTKSPAAIKFDLAIKELVGLKKVGKTGWFKGAKYTDGTPVAAIAARNEYGFKHTPPRSFMRSTIVERQVMWKTIATQTAKQVIRGDAPPEKILDNPAAQAAGDIRKKITEIMSPPLSPRTIAARIAAKKRGKLTESITKPLVDTGVMLNTLTHHVENK